MEISGKIIVINETQVISEKFSKRDFVIEYAENPDYPQFIRFQVIQDKCGLLDNFSAGQLVNVAFNLKGRKWVNPQGEELFFNTLEAWRIYQVGDTGNISPIPEPGAPVGDEDDDSLPF